MTIGLIWATIQASIGPAIWNLLKKVPWQAWAGLAAVLALLWFANWNRTVGYQRCQAEVAAAQATERARVQAEDAKTIAAANQRAVEAERRANDLETKVQDAITAAQEADERARAAAEEARKKGQPVPAGNTCLPSSVTDRLRNIR